ncbi:MAG: pantoate--beta-alanine ligase [Thermoanaerobaculia bacterium]|nr:pantoate--beta-alanine ligase [Thermoanaerobaculia bacterium]
MRICRSIEEIRDAVVAARRGGARVGFVPTMGFLHEGHLSLVDLARASGCGFVAVSIFVNPTQFGPNEDFARYPRDEARDIGLLEARGVDVLFLPPVEVVYPAGHTTRVTVAGVSEPLEGERRPGHFEGVATVVLKLFNVVQPDVAAFGHKDAQQCAVIARMVRDLDVPVELVFAETTRERDGLAMSSRNAYLAAEERAQAPRFREALDAGVAAIRRGASTAEAEAAMVASLASHPAFEIDYLRIVDPGTFRTTEERDRELLAVGAVRLGRTRLIDNLRIKPLATEASVQPREAVQSRSNEERS